MSQKMSTFLWFPRAPSGAGHLCMFCSQASNFAFSTLAGQSCFFRTIVVPPPPPLRPPAPGPDASTSRSASLTSFMLELMSWSPDRSTGCADESVQTSPVSERVRAVARPP